MHFEATLLHVTHVIDIIAYNAGVTVQGQQQAAVG